jgi:hypothetical protein
MPSFFSGTYTVPKFKKYKSITAKHDANIHQHSLQEFKRKKDSKVYAYPGIQVKMKKEDPCTQLVKCN